MSRIASFAPIVGPQARILILGSMPGAASLAAQQYYAHPRNAFWPIMAALLDIDLAQSYPQRVTALQAAGIAVWDVLRSCQRYGSLDSAIKEPEANDLAGFLAQNASIHCVGFNGAMAERSFQKSVDMSAIKRPIRYLRLPSTSPAHASLSLGAKLEAWRQMLAIGPS